MCCCTTTQAPREHESKHNGKHNDCHGHKSHGAAIERTATQSTQLQHTAVRGLLLLECKAEPRDATTRAQVGTKQFREGDKR